MTDKLKIMFVPMELVGHINSGIGLAHTLKSRGHHIVWAVDPSHKELVITNGFDVEVIDNFLWKDNSFTEFESRVTVQLGWTQPKTVYWLMSRLTNWVTLAKLYYQVIFSFFNKDYKLRQMIARLKPDVLIVDDVFAYPSIIYSQKPWVWLFSSNPLGFYQDESLPPPFMGNNKLNMFLINNL